MIKQIPLSLVLLGFPLVLSAEPTLQGLKSQAGVETDAGQAPSVNGTPAINPITQALLQSSNRSPYDVLKEFYESAATSASAGDFSVFDENTRQKCVFAHTSIIHGWSLRPINIHRVAKILPGKPRQGPLFPGTPDTRIEKVLEWDPTNRDQNDHIALLFDYAENAQEGMDFVIRSSLPPKWVGHSTRTYYRKNKSLLSFHGFWEGGPQNGEYYGYCYQE